MENTYTEAEVKEIIYKTVDKCSGLHNETIKKGVSNDIFEQLKKKEPRVFYRVCHEHSLRGLWYDYQGSFTGIIHNEFDFCLHNELKMDFDPELVGWLSATESLDDLFKWFPISDILKLQQEGWYLHKFVATDVKFYDRFQHMVINQETSKPLEKLILQKKELSCPTEIKTVTDGNLEVIIINQ